MRLLITTQVVDKNDPILGFFHGWLLEFSKHFEHIHVICLREGIHELPENVSVHSLGKEKGENRFKYTWLFYKYFWQVFMNSHVDFVFFHMGAVYNILALPFFIIRKLRQTKFYWWKTHGKIGHLKERIALKLCDAVFTAGNKSFAIPTNKVHVVGHAIDTDRFSMSPAILGTRPDMMLVVGRITPIKKIEIAIKAIAELETKSKEVELRIIGSGDEPEYQAFLEKTIVEESIDSVTFVGPKTQNEMLIEYKQASMLLHPAYEAGFDKVVLEAMATGVVPLTSIPSFKEILSEFGLYIAPMNTEEYAKRIEQIMEMNESEHAELVKRLRTIVVESHALKTLPHRIFGI